MIKIYNKVQDLKYNYNIENQVAKYRHPAIKTKITSLVLRKQLVFLLLEIIQARLAYNIYYK